MKIKSLFIISTLLISFFPSRTVDAQNLNTVNVQSLSTEQVNQAKQALGTSGLSKELAIAEARKRGASEAQIQQMLARMGETGQSVVTDSTLVGESNLVLTTRDSLTMLDEMKKTSSTEAEPAIFGSYLFNGKNLTFEPALNVQTPKKYELNIGDELIINIWGNSVQNYQLTVDKNGQIQIPQIGPVFVLGKTFDDVNKMIKQRLIAIYSGMGGSQPNTFAQINMGRLRSIKVNLVGEVNMPGTYTLPATATVFNALFLSGGPSKIGSFRTIKIFRDNELIRTLDIYDFLLRGDQKDNIVLKNEDVIFIPVSAKTITTKGEFKRNAIFEIKENEVLSDLITFAGGFTDETYLLNLKFYRKTQTGLQVLDVPNSLIATTKLTNGDIVISQRIRQTIENRVTITGSVFRPGMYEWKEKMTVSQLILKADSLIPNTMVEMGQINRINPDDYSLSQIAFNVKDVLSGKNDMLLQPKDSVVIKSQYDLKDKPNIVVDGRVRKGGSFVYKENMSILDAIFLAGGFTEDADSTFVQISRRLTYQAAATLSDKLVDVFNIPMPRVLNANDERSSFKLEPYDRIYVRKAPGYMDQGRVFIGGEVTYAGFYAIQNKKNRISDLIAWAGGTTPEAFIDGASLSKIDVGKVGLDLEKVINNPGSRNDLLLNPGDSLYIPKRPETVNVVGQVQNPFAKVYIPGKSVKYYIKNSGGWGEKPDKKRVYVTYPDGSSDMTRNFIFRDYPRVKPGSKIFVPKQPERTPRPELAQMWLGIGTTAATLAMTIISIVNLVK